MCAAASIFPEASPSLLPGKTWRGCQLSLSSDLGTGSGTQELSARGALLDSLIKIKPSGTSLVVQWLRLHASNAGGTGSIPGQGTKIPHAVTKIQCSQIDTLKKKAIFSKISIEKKHKNFPCSLVACRMKSELISLILD